MCLTRDLYNETMYPFFTLDGNFKITLQLNLFNSTWRIAKNSLN